MSSAKNLSFDDKPPGRSSTYIIKRNGTSIEPWGTPALMSAQGKACTLSTQALI